MTLPPLTLAVPEVMYSAMYNQNAMARMVRKQLYIDKRQDEALKRRARELGISEAEVVRQALADSLAVPEDNDREKAWARELAFMRERAKMKVPQQARTWTRDELYDR